MAFITPEYYQELKKNKMIERNDFTNLSKQSREVGLKNGKGYSRQTFRNILEKGFTTIPEMIELILNYYNPKTEALQKQQKSINEMKKKLAVPVQ